MVLAASQIRLQLLEAFLERLAQARDPEAYVVRGGMLVRHWFPSSGRPVRDIDLVCRLPYDAKALRSRIGEILAQPDHRGDTYFNAEHFRLDPLWPRSSQPGFRLYAAGKTKGGQSDMTIDFSFNIPLWPPPQRHQFRTSRGLIYLWTSTPETIVGRKLRVTSQLGRQHWRPKDLHDVYLILRRFGSASDHFEEAVERTFSENEARHELEPPNEIFSPLRWQDPQAQHRWHKFIRTLKNSEIPPRIEAVVGEVRSHLGILRRRS